MPITFEDMGLDYGFMLYSTVIKYTDDQKRAVTIEGLHDRATVYVNGKYIRMRNARPQIRADDI